MDPGSVSQGVQGCPSPVMTERGEGNGGCNCGDGLPPGTGNGGCNRSDGLPPVPGTPCQQGSGSGMDGQTPETSTMPQQQPQQQQANVSQNVQGFASTTNLDASGQGYPVQGCQPGNMPVMQGQGPACFGAQCNNKRLCNRIRKRVYRVLVVRVCLVDQGLVVFQT